MNLSMNGNPGAKGDDVLVRAMADTWGGQNLYCPDCASPRLERQDMGDLACSACQSRFQLKARAGDSLADWKDEMKGRAIHRDAAPSFFFMEYDAVSWTVRNLLLVPHFAIPPKATQAAAGRPRPIGFSLDAVPAEARISIVTTIKPSAKGNTECVMISTPEEVRGKFGRFKPFKKLKPTQRGLALELLHCMHTLTEKKRQARKPAGFTTEELCTLGRRGVKADRNAISLRQAEHQLQFLCSVGFVAPPLRDRWRLK